MYGHREWDHSRTVPRPARRSERSRATEGARLHQPGSRRGVRARALVVHRGPLASTPAAPEWSKQLFTVGVTGTNGKTSAPAMVAAGLGCLARPVATITTVGFWLDQERVNQPFNYGGSLAVMRACLDRGGR